MADKSIKLTVGAWACIGPHGHLFVTEFSPHDACIDRFQIYSSEKAARGNDIRVVPVTITYQIPTQCSKGGEHKWRTDGQHQNQFCGKRFVAKPEGR